MSKLSVLLCVLIAGITVFMADIIINQRPNTPLAETVLMHNVHVLRTIDDYHYLMKTEDGIVFHAHFCSTYEPQFDGGMILDVLQFEDRGDCWDLRRTHPAYLIRRDHNGRIIKEAPARSDTTGLPESTQ